MRPPASLASRGPSSSPGTCGRTSCEQKLCRVSLKAVYEITVSLCIVILRCLTPYVLPYKERCLTLYILSYKGVWRVIDNSQCPPMGRTSYEQKVCRVLLNFQGCLRNSAFLCNCCKKRRNRMSLQVQSHVGAPGPRSLGLAQKIPLTASAPRWSPPRHDSGSASAVAGSREFR